METLHSAAPGASVTVVAKAPHHLPRTVLLAVREACCLWDK
jgi:hypothetical protein